MAWLSTFVLSIFASLTHPSDSKRARVANLMQFLDTDTSGRLPFPASMKGAYIEEQYLGKGTFGMSFLVTEIATRRKMVMKLLYRKQKKTTGAKGETFEYYTWEKVKRSKWAKEEVMKAAEECDVAGYIHSQGKTMQHPGAQRVMNCFGHNVPVSDGKIVKRKGTAAENARADNQPLYMLLENCGDKDLTKFMAYKASMGELTLALVKNLFKQILEGLYYLASLGVPYIHHDLKPDNIVVKTQDDDTFSVHLIDFGASTQSDIGLMCQWTPCTPIFAPAEYDIRNPRMCGAATQNFEVCGSANRHQCPLAFDIYSAGCILPQLLTGIYLADFDPKFWSGKKKTLDHAEISNSLQTFAQFTRYLAQARRSKDIRQKMIGYDAVMTDLIREGEIFMRPLAGMLATQAEHRWTAFDLLTDSWLSTVTTDDDYDYQAELQSALAHGHADREKVEPDAPTFVKPGADALQNLQIYGVGQKVEVFSNTIFQSTGNGWTPALVSEVFRNGRVVVSYLFRKEVLSKELDQYDAAIRPLLVEDLVKDDERVQSQSIRENFVPAKRKQKQRPARVVHQVVRLDEEPENDDEDLSKASCPEVCWKCEPAMQDNGKRRTFKKRWASYCYVPMSAGIMSIVDGAVSCEATPSSGHEILRRKVNRFLCQDKALLKVTPKI